MQHHQRPRRGTHRRGLTLIELVVVLTILVALGAIIVPVIGNAITRSHLATCLTNFPEVSKMLITANATRGEFGDGWTNPVRADGSPAEGFEAADYGSLTQDQIDALTDLGMVNFTNLGDPSAIDGYNVTFNNGVVPGAGSPLTTGDEVAVLSADDAQNVFLPPAAAGQQYVFFAIDKSWSLLGDLTPEPPVHFGDSPGSLPDEVYSRFGAIFLVDDGDSSITGDGSAEFKRVSVHIGEVGLGGAYETADAHSAVYWDEVDEQD